MTPRTSTTIIVLLALSVGIRSTSRIGKQTFARSTPEQIGCSENLLLKLPNESFTASSVWKNGVEFAPHQARMSRMVETGSSPTGQAWCPKSIVRTEPEEWIEIDLGELKFIKNVFTMGRGDGNFEEFVAYFYFDYARESNKWHRYRTADDKEILSGNSDSRNVARTNFDSPIVAKKIRIYPISKDSPSRACMRIGIYGCDYNDGVVEYHINQGHEYVNEQNDKYDLRDLTYDGNKTGKIHQQKLNGGLGQLMDNVIYKGTVTEDKEKVAGFHFIGWNRNVLNADQVEIILKFDQMRSVKQIRFYAVNMIESRIGAFSNAVIHFSIGGKIYDQISSAVRYDTKSDRRLYLSRWIDIPVDNIQCRYLKIDLIFQLDWIVLSEIIVVSEKSGMLLPNEVITPVKTLPPFMTTSEQNIETNSVTVPKQPVYNQPKKDVNQFNTNYFPSNSSFGFIVTLASCFLAFLLIISLILFAICAFKRRHRRKKGKLRNPIYQSRMNGVPFLNDSVVVPLTSATHSSGGGSTYYKHPDLGLNYPIAGKEYMTLSSKSGTDYDMAGGNSLDGLLPVSKEGKYLGFGSQHSQNPETPYTVNPYSRNSMDGSTGGSSNTEYASTSLYHFPYICDNTSHLSTFTNATNNFPLQSINPTLMTPLSGSPFKVQSPVPSAQIYAPSHIANIFPQYSPYRQIPYSDHPNPMHCAPSRFLTPLHLDMYPMQNMSPNQYYVPSSYVKPNNLPLINGIFGNSVMVTMDQKSQDATDLLDLTVILANLKEIDQDQIEHISIIGRGENGAIGFTRITESYGNQIDKIQTKTYLSKSVNNYGSKEMRKDIIQEIGLLASIEHSSFLRLVAYTFDHQNSISMKHMTLCFLFEFDEPMENLYTFLQQQTIRKPGLISLPRSPLLYSQMDSDMTNNTLTNPQNSHPNIPMLLYISLQVAKAMSYLESRKIIHRDLAARNCLISKSLTVKVTDIAMSIQIFKDHYIEFPSLRAQDGDHNDDGAITVIRQSYPFQWMAAETILNGIYSIKTDVWSFGVTFWEIITRCSQPPYGNLGLSIDILIENAHLHICGSPNAVLPSSRMVSYSKYSNHQKSPYKDSLRFPDFIFDPNIGLTRDISDLVRECWHKNSIQRPTFQNISNFIEQKLSHFQINSREIYNEN